MTLALPFAALGGLLLGSFLNVVAHRLPRQEPIASDRSRCPGCGAQIRALDNVPVLSWMLLRGRCRDCNQPISARYPLVEAGTAVLMAAVVAVHHGDTARLVLGLVLVALLVPIALIDLDRRIIPNRLTGLGAVAALAIGIALDPGGQPERLIAAAAAGGFFLLAALARPGGMGMGDVKLAAMMGLFLGAEIVPALLIALLLGTVIGAVLVARQGAAARKATVPFGPFLALGAVVGLLAGAPVLSWYTGILG
jgi:leader peptidase (prepilin peptidase)/N-methyltransferase